MSTLDAFLFTRESVSVLLFGGGALLFAILYRGARLSPEPWYASENMISIVFGPLCVMLLVGGGVGLAQVVQRLGEAPVGMAHAVAAGLGVLLAVGTVAVMRITPRAPAVGSSVVTLPQAGPTAPQPPRPVPAKRAA